VAFCRSQLLASYWLEASGPHHVSGHLLRGAGELKVSCLFWFGSLLIPGSTSVVRWCLVLHIPLSQAPVPHLPGCTSSWSLYMVQRAVSPCYRAYAWPGPLPGPLCPAPPWLTLQADVTLWGPTSYPPATSVSLRALRTSCTSPAPTCVTVWHLLSSLDWSLHDGRPCFAHNVWHWLWMQRLSYSLQAPLSQTPWHFQCSWISLAQSWWSPHACRTELPFFSLAFMAPEMWFLPSGLASQTPKFYLLVLRHAVCFTFVILFLLFPVPCNGLYQNLFLEKNSM
jgi:hypothetical protein